MSTVDGIVLFGHGNLAVAVLMRLESEGRAVIAVVDSEGEGGVLTACAQDSGIPASSIHPRKDEVRLIHFLGEFAPNAAVLLSVNFRYIIGKAILQRFSWPLNIHGSLLPKYRGRTPHVWAIINGEAETGATLHVMDEGIDTGPIVAQKKIAIGPDDTGAAVLKQFSHLYPDLVIEGLKAIRRGMAPEQQDNTYATFFGKRTPDMGIIDFRLPFKKLRDFVRAIAPPYPGAYCYLTDGTRLVVDHVTLRTDLSVFGPKYSPRLIDDEILVHTDDGIVQIHPVEVTQ